MIMFPYDCISRRCFSMLLQTTMDTDLTQPAEQAVPDSCPGKPLCQRRETLIRG